MTVDWATLINWIIAGIVGLAFGSLGAIVTHRLQQRRDDLAWTRRRDELEAQWKVDVIKLDMAWQQKLDERNHQEQKDRSTQVHNDLTAGLDKVRFVSSLTDLQRVIDELKGKA